MGIGVNTCRYFYYTFKESDERKAHQIPFSGHPSARKLVEASNFTDRYVKRILEPVLAKSYNRLIIVDSENNGAGMEAFVRILRRVKHLKRNSNGHDAYFMRLTGVVSQSRSRYVKSIPYAEQIVVGTCEEDFSFFKEDKQRRVVPPYPIQYWDEEPGSVQYPGMEYRGPLIARIKGYRGCRCEQEGSS